MKYYILLGLLAVATAYPGVIHEEAPQVEEKFDHAALIGESEHHHHVQHEHAKSHQSIKFEHFHPVPVYVKKEHSHLLKHPLEKGKSEHNLKLIHPETEYKHGGGLVLEDHRFDTEELAHGLEANHGFEELSHGFQGSEGLGLHEFHHPVQEIEGGHYQYQPEQAQGLTGSESLEGYKFEGY